MISCKDESDRQSLGKKITGKGAGAIAEKEKQHTI